MATFGDVLISGTDVILPSNGRSGLKNSLNYSYTLYNDQRTEIGSKKDIVLRLDRDALVNPSSLVSSFQILNASDNKVFEVTDTGEASVAGGILVQSLSAKTEVKVGEGESSLVATPNDITTYANNFHLAIDKEGLAPLASFNVTSGGYKGIDPSNENVILQATNEKLVSGTTYLKPGLIEDGEFGFKFFSRNPGGEFHGYFVPFRQLKTSIPSVVFVVDSDTSVNVNTVQVAYATTSGFFIECDSMTTGSVMLRGRYEA